MFEPHGVGPDAAHDEPRGEREEGVRPEDVGAAAHRELVARPQHREGGGVVGGFADAHLRARRVDGDVGAPQLDDGPEVAVGRAHAVEPRVGRRRERVHVVVEAVAHRGVHRSAGEGVEALVARDLGRLPVEHLDGREDPLAADHLRRDGRADLPHAVRPRGDRDDQREEREPVVVEVDLARDGERARLPHVDQELRGDPEARRRERGAVVVVGPHDGDVVDEPLARDRRPGLEADVVLVEVGVGGAVDERRAAAAAVVAVVRDLGRLAVHVVEGDGVALGAGVAVVAVAELPEG